MPNNDDITTSNGIGANPNNATENQDGLIAINADQIITAIERLFSEEKSINKSNHFPDDFVYFNFKIQDNNKDRLFDFLEESYRKIKEYQNNNDGAILVHCFMGASRSATVVAHYIIKEHEYTPDLAIVFIKEKRIIVNLTNRLYNDLCDKYNQDKLMFQ